MASADRKSGNRWRSSSGPKIVEGSAGDAPGGSTVAVGTKGDFAAVAADWLSAAGSCLVHARRCGNGIMTETGHSPRNGRGPVRDKAVARCATRPAYCDWQHSPVTIQRTCLIVTALVATRTVHDCSSVVVCPVDQSLPPPPPISATFKIENLTLPWICIFSPTAS